MFSPDLISKCVKRHMNINFKKNLVAMLAVASATAFAPDTCLGMQNSANSSMAVGTGIVKPVASSYAGAFGSVVPAPDTGSYYRDSSLPPIVSSAQSSPELPPIVTAPQVVQAKPLAANLSSPKFQRKNSVMLAPIEPSKPKIEVSTIDPNMAPPTIIKASNAFAHDSDESKVAQAAQWGPGGYVRTATSSAGVPLYPRSAAPVPPQVNNQPPRAASQRVPPIISADSMLVSPNSSVVPVSSVASLPANPTSATTPATTTAVTTSTLDPSYEPAPTSYSQGSGSTSFAQGSGSTSFAQGSGSTSGFAATTASPQYLSGPVSYTHLTLPTICSV